MQDNNSATRISFTVADQPFRQKLLSFAASFPKCVWLETALDNIDKYGKYDILIGLAGENADAIEDWKALSQSKPDWQMGILSYDLKNVFEPSLHSENPVTIPVSELLFFQPEIRIWKNRADEVWNIEANDPENIRKAIELSELIYEEKKTFQGFQSNFSKEEYLQTVQQLRNHIREGDVYEINLCQEFSANAKIEQPILLWDQLNKISPSPFASYFRWNEIYMIGASPERFLQLEGDRLITQPIKGTITRGENPDDDQRNAETLLHSEKELAENVMIVDLSRNDLNRSSKPGTVHVPHLFEVQSFPQVHHLVSTIQGTKSDSVSTFDAIKNAFPPGSMTGAPKVKAMQLIEHFERSSRGIYSGSIGWRDAEENFDFNVVIRSLIYDHVNSKISYHVGGAITWDSDPEQEYEETLLKAKAISELMGRR